MGALGVICPIISSAEEARNFAAGARYHPVGNRSSGPLRANIEYGGAEYFKRANDTILVLGMIGTPGAIANLDHIIAVETMDGLSVGPHEPGIVLAMPPGTCP